VSRRRLAVEQRLANLIGTAYAFEDLDEFRHGILPELRETVPADRASYNEFDDQPDRTWWIADPALSITPEMAERFATMVTQNPVLAHHQRTGDGRPRRISDFVDRATWHQMPVYTDFYRHVGVEAMIGFTLPSRPPVTIGIALIRAEGDFADEEVATVAAARPHLIRAYRTVELSSARRATIAAIEAGLETLGSAVLVVDGHGRVDLATPSARRLLAGRLGAASGRLAPDVVARLAERRAARTPVTEPLVLEDADGTRLSLRVLAGPEGNTDMLVVEPGSSGLSVAALQGLGLTRREAEALRWIALGRRGPQAAQLMGVSPRTVETHLQNAYAKLDVHTAADAAATAWAAVGVRLPQLSDGGAA